VVVWDARLGVIQQQFAGHHGIVKGIAFSKDGRTAYSTGLDGTVIAWDLGGDRRLGRPFHLTDASQSLAPFDAPPVLAASPDGGTFVAPLADGSIAVVDAASERVRIVPALPPTTKGPFAGATPALSAAFSPDGKLAAVGGGLGRIGLWTTNAWTFQRWLHGPPLMVSGQPNAVRAIAFSPDGHTAAAGDGGGLIYRWSVSNGEPLGRPIRTVDDQTRQPNRGISALTFSPDGRRVFAAYDAYLGREKRFSGWGSGFDLRTGRRLYDVDIDNGYGHANSIALTPDGRTLITGGGTGYVRFWDAATGRRTSQQILANPGWVVAAVDGTTNMLITSGSGGPPRIYDLGTHQEIGSPLAGIEEAGNFAIPVLGGTAIAVRADDGWGYVWDLRPPIWSRLACAIAGRQLTPTEWHAFVPGRRYARVCPG
jgi:WD40 repeat protein